MKAIVDCNSFYCSCEKVFRPDLKQKPVVVLSNNDGCVIARSDEAKQLGVAMAGPYFLAKPIIEQFGVEAFSSNYNLYGDMSKRVMEVLKLYAGEENIEVYSIDEAFLDLKGYSEEQLRQLAEDLKHTITQWVGIDVSIGISFTKTLSKLANRLAKKDKAASKCVKVLGNNTSIAAALQQTKVDDVWGVGKKYADKLHSFDLHTAWDLRNVSQEWARSHLGGVVGVRLIKELNGEEAIVMQDELVNKKMITTSRMFGSLVTDVKDIKEAVATYVGRAAEKLRRQYAAANIIQVFLVSKEKVEGPKFSHGPTVASYFILPQPTSITSELIKPAVQIAEQLFMQGKRYNKAGVILSGLVPDDSIQGNLFQSSKQNGRFLMDMIDNINFSMRDDVIKFAASGMKRNWKMRQNFHSPRYTTRWEELREVG